MFKIVVVDDQPVFRDVVRYILGDDFVVVAEADNRTDAIAAVELHRPDAVIVDVNISTPTDEFQADGLRLAEELATLNPSIKIVLVSAFAETTYTRMAQLIPRTVFVEKASLTDELLRSIVSA